NLTRATAIGTGAGNDTVTFGSLTGSSAGGTLDKVNAQVAVDGGPGNDSVNLWNAAGSKSFSWSLGTKTLAFGLSKLGFNSIGHLNIVGGNLTDTLAVSAIPVGTTQTSFDGGGGYNAVYGPDVDTTFDLVAPNAGLMNGGAIVFGNVLYVNGGAADDTFRIAPGIDAGVSIDGHGGGNLLDYTNWTASVTVNLDTGNASGALGVANVDDVVGGKGSDYLTGNAEANHLSGGDGNDLLLGNDGDDVLTGGAGRNILIGGQGADLLTGGQDDDILIDGTTDYDGDAASLRNIQTLWTDPSSDYQTRVFAVYTNFPEKLTSNTVHHDGKVDEETGLGGRDWFWGNVSSRTFGFTDTYTDRQLDEYLNDPSFRTFPGTGGGAT
ncbi:MAG TPA: hypothetical protein VF796_11450, partial [Humisphaera sp.]